MKKLVVVLSLFCMMVILAGCKYEIIYDFTEGNGVRVTSAVYYSEDEINTAKMTEEELKQFEVVTLDDGKTYYKNSETQIKSIDEISKDTSLGIIKANLIYIPLNTVEEKEKENSNATGDGIEDLENSIDYDFSFILTEDIVETNGTLSERFRMLDHPSVRKVSFSVQSIEFHHECNPSVYMENILSFCRRASAAGRPYCEIRFWRSDQFTSERTVQAYEYVLSRYPLQDTKRKNSFRLMDHVFLSIDNSFDWPDLNHDEVAARGYCIGSLKQLAVLSDGTVVPCCLDAEGAVSFGNLFRDDMAMILSERPCAVAGVFTKNVVKAAPVQYDKALVQQNGLADKVELSGKFCMGKCGEGVCVTIDDVTHIIQKEEAEEFFNREILAKAV